MNALSLQHDVDTPIAKAPAFRSNCPDSLTQLGITWSNALVANTRSINLQNTTRPTLAHSVLITQVNHRISLSFGRYHFFELISFNIALSSICSASSFFNLAFSDSKLFNLRASDTSIPPNLALYL
jgi:hypothetical protein